MIVWLGSRRCRSSSGSPRPGTGRGARHPDPAVVPHRMASRDLPNAIAVNSAIFNGARVVGPAIGGQPVERGRGSGMLLPERGVVPRGPGGARPQCGSPLEPRAARAAARGGIRLGPALRVGVPVLRNLLLLSGSCARSACSTSSSCRLRQDRLRGGRRGYGLLLTAAGIGSMTSSLQLATRRYSRLQHRRKPPARARHVCRRRAGRRGEPPFEMALLCQGCGVGHGSAYLATTNTLLQLAVDEGYRGRMMGLHAVMFLGNAADRRPRARRARTAVRARRAALVFREHGARGGGLAGVPAPAPGTP